MRERERERRRGKGGETRAKPRDDSIAKKGRDGKVDRMRWKPDKKGRASCIEEKRKIDGKCSERDGRSKRGEESGQSS